jgi:hypothetical protein
MIGTSWVLFAGGFPQRSDRFVVIRPPNTRTGCRFPLRVRPNPLYNGKKRGNIKCSSGAAPPIILEASSESNRS